MSRTWRWVMPLWGALALSACQPGGASLHLDVAVGNSVGDATLGLVADVDLEVSGVEQWHGKLGALSSPERRRFGITYHADVGGPLDLTVRLLDRQGGVLAVGSYAGAQATTSRVQVVTLTLETPTQPDDGGDLGDGGIDLAHDQEVDRLEGDAQDAAFDGSADRAVDWAIDLPVDLTADRAQGVDSTPVDGPIDLPQDGPRDLTIIDQTPLDYVQLDFATPDYTVLDLVQLDYLEPDLTPCSDTKSDPLNCGFCGNICPGNAGGRACLGGHCGFILAIGQNNVEGLAVDGTYIYWTRRLAAAGGGDVRRARLSGGPTTTISSARDFPAQIVAVSGNVYWAETGAIIKYDGVSATTFVPGLSNPWGLTTNGSELFWTDQSNGDVGKVTIANQAITLLASGQTNPRPIAVDTMNVYWGIDNAVMRASVSGGGVAEPVYGANLPFAVAVGPAWVYWTEPANQQTDRLLRVDLTGGNYGSHNSNATASGLAYRDGLVYWEADGTIASTDWSTQVQKTELALFGQTSNRVPLIVDATHVYWASPDHQTIYKAPRLP